MIDVRRHWLGYAIFLLVAALLIVAPALAQESSSDSSQLALAQETQTQETQTQETTEAVQAETPIQNPEDLGPVDVREGATDEEAEALRLVDQILHEQQLIVSGENFVYRAEGRRDPFRNLLAMRQREITAPTTRPPGLPGFLIGEIKVVAVAQFQGRWHAMLVGLDQRTYFAQVGDELFDGRIVRISEGEVIFEQEVEDLMGARTTRQVAKRLNTGTEE